MLSALGAAIGISEMVSDDEEEAGGDTEEHEETTPASPTPDPDDEDPEGENPVSKRPKGVPEDWAKKPANKKEGYKYGKPGREAYDDVRVQKGNPNSSNPAQQQDYIKWKKDGQYMDKNGNKVPSESPEAHIPINEFKFDKDIFK